MFLSILLLTISQKCNTPNILLAIIWAQSEPCKETSHTTTSKYFKLIKSCNIIDQKMLCEATSNCFFFSFSRTLQGK